jgi:hypothetical protein
MYLHIYIFRESLKGRFQTGFPLYTGIYSSGVSKNYFLIFLIFKFIWNGKPDKVKRNTLIGDFAKSGLKMIDIESYFIFLNASCRLTGNLSGIFLSMIL